MNEYQINISFTLSLSLSHSFCSLLILLFLFFCEQINCNKFSREITRNISPNTIFFFLACLPLFSTKRTQRLLLIAFNARMRSLGAGYFTTLNFFIMKFVYSVVWLKITLLMIKNSWKCTIESTVIETLNNGLK